MTWCLLHKPKVRSWELERRRPEYTNYRSASNKKLANTAKKGGNNKADQAADGVKALKVDDTPLPKSKNLDVLGEYEKSKSKKSASFVVVGKTLPVISLKIAALSDCRKVTWMLERAR